MQHPVDFHGAVVVGPAHASGFTSIGIVEFGVILSVQINLANVGYGSHERGGESISGRRQRKKLPGRRRQHHGGRLVARQIYYGSLAAENPSHWKNNSGGESSGARPLEARV